MGLTGFSNIDLIEKQVLEFKPKYVALVDEKLSTELGKRLKGLNVEVYHGLEGLIKVATLREIDTVVTSIVGIAGLTPTMEAIRHKKNIALANKETLVTAGSVVMNEAKKYNVDILPVDSEHFAIFQCLMGNNNKEVEKIILTASRRSF